MDSTTSLSILQTTEKPSHQHASLVLQFRSLMQRDWIVNLSHVFREDNCLADCLAHRRFIPFGVYNISSSKTDINGDLGIWVMYHTMEISTPRRINTIR
ncbi:hypothetical protein LINGRAHAP2_LOCUS16162 [Linum grandiflorum]